MADRVDSLRKNRFNVLNACHIAVRVVRTRRHDLARSVEFVIDDEDGVTVVKQASAQMAADETCPACHQNAHSSRPSACGSFSSSSAITCHSCKRSSTRSYCGGVQASGGLDAVLSP